MMELTYFAWIMAFYMEGRLFCQVLKIIFMYLVSLNYLLESLLEVRVLKVLKVSIYIRIRFSCLRLQYTFRGVSRPSGVSI